MSNMRENKTEYPLSGRCSVLSDLPRCGRICIVICGRLSLLRDAFSVGETVRIIRENAFIKTKSSTVLTPRETAFLMRRMVKRYSHSMPYIK